MRSGLVLLAIARFGEVRFIFIFRVRHDAVWWSAVGHGIGIVIS